MDKYHVSVFLSEALEYLNVTQNGKYVDATLGGGGHTLEIAKRGGSVLGIDVDKEAVEYVRQQLTTDSSHLAERVRLASGNFREIGRIAREEGFEAVAGILFDLGVSSHQVDTPERGFSFGKAGPLDMRMDQTLSVQAKDLVNGLSKKELKDLFERFGEEKFAERIASYIVKRRSVEPIETTEQLATVVKRAVPFDQTDIHPATRIFQALRIIVNDELHSIEEALPQSLELLGNGGRLVVISFHSLEDRIVKKAFEEFEKQGKGKILTKKPIVPTEAEQSMNRRSRSAKLRVFERNI